MMAVPRADTTDSPVGRRLEPATKLTADDAARMIARGEPTGLRRRLLVTRQKVFDKAQRGLGKALTALENVGPLARFVRCPICHWGGLAFRPFAGPGYLSFNVTCPGCGAQGRQRLFHWVWSQRPRQTGLILYFAPEICLKPSICGDGARVLTTDLVDRRVDFAADAQRIPLPDESVALCLCSDVLEHVEHDVLALIEIRRVLAPGGVALVHVPVVIDRTLEFGQANDDDYGHRRAYGPDVVDRMQEAGLEVALIYADAIPSPARRRMGIGRGDVVFVLARSTADLRAWSDASVSSPVSAGRMERPMNGDPRGQHRRPVEVPMH